MPREIAVRITKPPHSSEPSSANWHEDAANDLITSSFRVGGEIATSLQNISRCLAGMRLLPS